VCVVYTFCLLQCVCGVDLSSSRMRVYGIYGGCVWCELLVIWKMCCLLHSVCIHTHTHMHTCTHAHTYTHTHTHTHTHSHTRTHTRTHTHTQTNTQICMHTYARTHTHAHAHTLAHTHTHTFMKCNVCYRVDTHSRLPNLHDFFRKRALLYLNSFAEDTYRVAKMHRMPYLDRSCSAK